MQINFKEHKFVVIGAGLTGCSIIDYLRYQNAQILRVLDTRNSPPKIDGIKVIGGDLQWEQVADSDIIAISPGVSLAEPVLQQALRHNKKVVGDIELFAQAIASWPSRVIGISGSNGKTTVTSLTGFLAQESGISTLIAGNIGTPALSAYLESQKKGYIPQLIVLELSSFQLETTISLRLDSASVLNLSEDHLDRYCDLLEYASAKARIFANCALQVLNAADPLVMAMRRSYCQQLFFAEDNAEYSLHTANHELYLMIKNKPFIAVSQLQLMGTHNYINCLASLALLAGAGYDLFCFRSALTRFKGLEHRMQKVCEHNGILYIEDSKGTNVGAVIAGVTGISRPVNLILGGDGKAQDFSPLRSLVQGKCKSVALIGQDALLIAEVLQGLPRVQLCNSLEDAVAWCIANSAPGDAVILSPACASWDMFTDYKHRAQVFIETVYAYTQKIV